MVQWKYSAIGKRRVLPVFTFLLLMVTFVGTVTKDEGSSLPPTTSERQPVFYQTSERGFFMFPSDENQAKDRQDRPLQDSIQPTSKQKPVTSRCNCLNGGICLLNVFCHCSSEWKGKHCEIPAEPLPCGEIPHDGILLNMTGECSLCKCRAGSLICAQEYSCDEVNQIAQRYHAEKSTLRSVTTTSLGLSSCSCIRSCLTVPLVTATLAMVWLLHS